MKITNTTQKITVSAILIALSTVLSFFKIEMPLGGGLSALSMLPIALLCCMLDIKWAFLASFVYSLIQTAISFTEVFSWGLSPVALIATYLVDYVLAYTVLGFSGIFKRRGNIGIVLGIALAIFLRFVCHFFTGALIFDIWCEWQSAWLYSLCYNGAYMLPEIILTSAVAAAWLKYEQIKKLFA